MFCGLMVCTTGVAGRTVHPMRQPRARHPLPWPPHCRSIPAIRLSLISARAPSMPPSEAAFRRLWPEATLMNLLDDSLAADLARDGGLTPAMTDRFLSLARYAKISGSDAILFTCSAFGPCIEA